MTHKRRTQNSGAEVTHFGASRSVVGALQEKHMNRPLHRPFRTIVLTSVAAGTLALAAARCRRRLPTILSRLPEPGASGGQPPTLSSAERKRYDEIDQQVLREQNSAMAAEPRALGLLAAAGDGLRRVLRRMGQSLETGHQLRLPGMVVVSVHRSAN